MATSINFVLQNTNCFFTELRLNFRCVFKNNLACRPGSIEWFKEDQGFMRSYDSAPRPPLSSPFLSAVVSFSHFLWMSPVELTDGRSEGGWGRSQIIRPRETKLNEYSLLSPIGGYIICTVLDSNVMHLHTAYCRAQYRSSLYNVYCTHYSSKIQLCDLCLSWQLTFKRSSDMTEKHVPVLVFINLCLLIKFYLEDISVLSLSFWRNF